MWQTDGQTDDTFNGIVLFIGLLRCHAIKMKKCLLQKLLTHLLPPVTGSSSMFQLHDYRSMWHSLFRCRNSNSSLSLLLWTCTSAVVNRPQRTVALQSRWHAVSPWVALCCSWSWSAKAEALGIIVVNFINCKDCFIISLNRIIDCVVCG